jgi:NAD(P)-dependent dehydrogenase (short-subunit alcohol dehydrogenase family)
MNYARRRSGAPPVLVNNTSIGAQGTVADNNDAGWLRVIDVNLLGMAAHEPGGADASAAITGDDRQHRLNPGDTGPVQPALSSASTGGVVALTWAMAADHLSEGIRVNRVNLGTAGSRGSAGCSIGRRPRARASRAASRAAARQLVSPDEIAHPAAYSRALSRLPPRSSRALGYD